MMTDSRAQGPVLTMLLAALLAVAVTACSGGSETTPADVTRADATPGESSDPIASNPTPSSSGPGQTGTPAESTRTPAGNPTPTRSIPTVQPAGKPGVDPTATSTPAPGAALTRQTSPLVETADGELRYEGDVVEFEYTTAWRISDRAANSVTFTHVSAPGDALVTVQWEPGITPEVVAQYTARLELFADDVIQLENTVINGISATRTLIVGPGPDSETPGLVLAVVAIKGGVGVIVVFAAPPGLFDSLVPDVEEFIAAIHIR